MRIDPTLHAALRAAADRAGLSLNEYCARKLASGGVGMGDPGWQAVERAAAVVGGCLVGVAVYGSWARGEPMETSDVDVLVVVDPSTPITRRLYRAWDEEPVRWEERRVEPHFVHLPPPGRGPTGTWAEVALDGIVLFEAGSWADVVRESQEIVELALEALLRSVGIDPPRIHDVSEVLGVEAHRLPKNLREELGTLTRISRDLRRDRELAFHGAEDLTPSGFYTREDGERARADARTVVELVRPHIVGEGGPDRQEARPTVIPRLTPPTPRPTR